MCLLCWSCPLFSGHLLILQQKNVKMEKKEVSIVARTLKKKKQQDNIFRNKQKKEHNFQQLNEQHRVNNNEVGHS